MSSTVPPYRYPDPALRAAPDAPPSRPADLLRLVRRIAAKDHRAFTDLYHRLSSSVLYELESTMSDPVAADAITCATFVEVWTLARFHVSSDTDVYAWLTEIVGRRSADRRSASDADRRAASTGDWSDAPPRPSWQSAADRHDRQMALALRALLSRPPHIDG